MIKRASLADPQIADAIVLSPKQIYVTGKGYGTTNLTLWGKDDQVLAVFDLDVGVDLSAVETASRANCCLTRSNIHLKGTHDHVTISGTVSSEARLHQVLAVAEAYAPKKVLNFLKVYPEPIGSPAPRCSDGDGGSDQGHLCRVPSSSESVNLKRSTGNQDVWRNM